jgi:cytochrome bd-type quinol oxidase subunit 2
MATASPSPKSPSATGLATNTRTPVGILDWYTVLAGVFALTALTGHGATFLLWKSDGPVQSGAGGRRGASTRAWPCSGHC